MSRAVRTATAVALILMPGAALAQPNPPAPEPAALRGESAQTRKRLAEVEQKLLAGKAADAADELQRILDESGDDLVSLDGEQFRAARWVAHSLFARLPPDALKTYQDRIEQPAKKLLDRARRERDPRPLWQLLDRYFVSRPGAEALLLLGDLLFERGEFRAAEGAWRRLLPGAGADLVHPGPRPDPALVRARLALAAIFRHDLARAKAELAALKAKHPGATGTLAGKTGPLADALQALLDSPPKLAPDATGGAAWPTYGGAPDRAGRVPGGIPAAWAGRIAWHAEIKAEDKQRRFAFTPPARPPFGYPAIAGGEVFVASGNRVLGFNLRTGDPSRAEYAAFLPGPAEPKRDEPPSPDPECAVTAAGGRVYARLGPALLRAPVARDAGFIPDSAIVCLGLQTEGKFTEQWRLFPPEEKKVATAWEGAPLVAGRRMWAVYAKFEGGRVAHVAACYDPADAEKPPRPAWTAELCDSPPPPGDRRSRQELLTLAGRNLVFCSNAGAVVALDAATGKRAWAFRYPRSRKALTAAGGEPSPAVAFGGRVFVAPADGERVYALDAETGRLLWESGNTEGARVLGVARGKLVVTVAGPLRGVRGLNLDTGSHRDGGWIQGSEWLPLDYGHGFVTDDVIVWPSREGLYFLDPRNGWLKAGRPNPWRGPFGQKFFGHVAYAEKRLVVVTPTEVWAYYPESDTIESAPDATPQQRFDAMIDRAERAAAAGDADKARAALAEVAASDLPAPLRAWAAARMVQLSPLPPDASDFSRLPAETRAACRPPLLSEWVLPPNGVPVTLGAFVALRLGRIPPAGSAPAAPEATAACAPGLPADAEVVRTLNLPGAVSPLKLIAGAGCPPRHLFAAGPRTLLAVPLDRGAESTHAPADLFTHAADLRSGFVAAGPFAVALYDAASEPLWVFRMPTSERLPAEPSPFRFRAGGEAAAPHLSSFALAGAWLVARVGEYHLIALDLEARRVAWVLSASGRAGYEPAQFPRAPRFGPRFALCGKFAAVQLSDGRRWFVQLATGRPVAMPALGDRTARAWWPQAPASAGAKQLLLADGPGLVRLVQLGGRVKWSYEPESAEGFTGEPAQARVWGDVQSGGGNPPRVPPSPPLLLVAVRRNHGVEVERVDLASGKGGWPVGPAFADADRIDLASADADPERAYVPAANKLLALSLRDGKPAWEADLPDARGPSGWVVRAGKACVIAYPAEAIPAEAPEAVWGRLGRSLRREPYPWRLPGLAATLYDAWVGREVPVLFFDPETGKRLARLDIPARGPAVAAHFGAGAAVVATGSRVVWIK